MRRGRSGRSRCTSEADLTFTGQLGTHASRLGRIVLGYIAPPVTPSPGVCRATNRSRTPITLATLARTILAVTDRDTGIAVHTMTRTVVSLTDQARTALLLTDRTP